MSRRCQQRATVSTVDAWFLSDKGADCNLKDLFFTEHHKAMGWFICSVHNI